MLSRLFAAFALIATLAAAHPAAAEDTLVVYAAASLKNALDDTNAAFTKATGVKVTASYEASSALDERTEAEIMGEIRALADDMTILAITHRKTVIAPGDVVVELTPQGVNERIAA